MNTREKRMLIAIFMGYICNGDDEYLIHPETNYDHSINDSEWFLYDSSWDWIMPVVDKCTQIGYRDQEFQSETYHEWEGLFADNTAMFVGNHIEEVYAACIEFIEFYNSIKPEK